MKKTLCVLLAFVLLFALIPFTHAVADNNLSFEDDPKAIQTASNSVVLLSCFDKNGDLYATGSGFAAFEEGVFVTNYHVIDGVYSIRAAMESGLEFRISSVVAHDQERDVAILRTEARTGVDPLPIGSTADLERGEKVIAIGSPLGLINTLSIGLYSGTIKDEQVFLQFSAPISHGSSGGALFNNRGEVVGITAASFTEGQNLNLAIPIEEVIALWENRYSTKELSISEFYEECRHPYTVLYILSHQSEFNGQTIEIVGYAFVDPTKYDRFYLVDNPEDVAMLRKALTQKNDDAIKGNNTSAREYSRLLKENAVIVYRGNLQVSPGELIRLQGNAVAYGSLENAVIID